MTREEAIQVLKEYRTMVINCLEAETPAFDLAIESLSADTVPKGVLEQFRWERDVAMMQLEEYGIPFCTNKDEDIVKVVRCKDCKYFKLDHFDMIDGVPIIIAHEICTKWSGGSKTNKDGFCFMGERREP